MNQRLNDEQTRLYDEFYNMDVTISQLQSDASVIATIGPIDISGDTSSSSSTSPSSSSGSGIQFNTGSGSSTS